MSTSCQELRAVLESVLMEAGEDPAMAGVYAALLTHDRLDEHSLAQVLEVSPETVPPLVRRLLELGLVRRREHSDERLLTAAGLEGPLSQLLAAAEDRAAISMDRVSRLRDSSSRAAQLLRQVQHLDPSEPESRILDSGTAVVDFLHQMNEECTTEVLSLVNRNPSPMTLRHSREPDLALLEKGVKVRSIYLSSARRQPELMDYLHQLEEHGAHLGLAPVLPTRILVFDNRLALIARDPGDLSSGALVVRPPGLIAALSWLFELCWQSAERLAPPDVPAAGLSAVELAMLRGFALGHKDAAIARQMEVSVRTVRRTVTQLNGRLGVGSRFELGVRAAELGLVGKSAPPAGQPGSPGRSTPGGSAPS